MSDSVNQRLFDRLVDASGDMRAGRLEKVCDAAPGSFVRTVSANVFTRLGDAIGSPKNTLAWRMGAVGAPAILVGTLLPIRAAGSLLAPLLIADFNRRLAIRKKVWVAGAPSSCCFPVYSVH